MLKRTIMYKPVIALTLLSAVNLVSSFPDSGKWVYKNITMSEQYIGKCLNFSTFKFNLQKTQPRQN